MGTPYDDVTAKGIYFQKDTWMNDADCNIQYCNGFYFTCVLGFSKRGLNKLLKESGYKRDRDTKKYLKDGVEVADMDCYNYMKSQP